MKKVITAGAALALSFIAFTTSAQVISIGVTAGMSAMTNNFGQRAESAAGLNVSNKTGAQIGVISRIGLPTFAIKPELLYSFHRLNVSAPGISSRRLTVHTIDFPVLFSKRYAFLTLDFGPVFNLSTSESNSRSSQIDFKVKRHSIGYAAGASISIRGVSIGARYTGQFRKASQSVSLNGGAPVRFKARTDTWQIALGITL